jgi:pyridoxine 5-phosphate synthase
MAQLSVNINKVALIRNSRGKDMPNIVCVAKDLIDMGAHGITMHPRPDARHATHKDIRDLKAQLIGRYLVEINVEGYPTQDFIDLILETRPAQVTLVPDLPNALTSNAGWNISRCQTQLKKIASELKPSGARVSFC